jgi:CRISPR-associated protein Cas1
LIEQMTVAPHAGAWIETRSPHKERLSVLFLEKGQLDVLYGAFVVIDKNGVRTHIPAGGVSCLML